MMADQKLIKQKNLEFFKQADPRLYDILINHEPASELVFGDDGEPDILVDGKLLYGGKASEFARKQIDTFWNDPYVYSTPPFKLGSLDRYGNPFLRRVDERARQDGVKFSEDLPLGRCFFLIVFGVGLGQHFDALFDTTDPYFVIFVEPNRDHFVHSAEIYPWHTLFEKLKKKGRKTAFAISDQPDQIAVLIEQLFREISPAAIDGTPIYVHTVSETTKATIKLLEQGVPHITREMGYLFDETLMMKNSYQNLCSGGNTLFVRTHEIEFETPVFVIGAGPSLDRDISFIREYAKRSIIVSTGTAIRSLLLNGITPDFHIEIENINVHSSIAELALSHDLSSICLVAPVTIDPHITGFFNDIVYFFRQFLCSYPLFCVNDIHCLRESGPSIINASLSFAIDIGARSICLFGTDFGTRGVGLDHAKDNVLFTESAVIGGGRDYNIPVAANFGGEFFTSDDFSQALRAAAKMISLYGKGRQFVNCSDGALIENAHPARSAQLSFGDSTAENKKADLQRIRERFTTFSKEWFDQCWNEATMKDVANKLADDLDGLFKDPSAFQNEDFIVRYTLNIRNPMMRDLSGLTRGDRVYAQGAVANMVRGTVDVILMAIKSLLRVVPDPVQFLRFQEIVRDEFQAVVETIRADVLAVINDPTDIPPPKTIKNKDAEEYSFAERPQSWGKVARNAPCPCNSGKRYKHCHGKS